MTEKPPAPPSVADFLGKKRDEVAEDLQPLVLQFEDQWERKLWHQLTQSLVEFFVHPESGPQRLDFFKLFILRFADKINQLKLVELALAAAKECQGKEERLSFLQSVAETIDKKTSPAARAYAEVEVARVKLDTGNLDDVRKDLDDVERALDMLDSVDNIVNAAFYDVNADYYNRKEDFAAYYRNALLYLACVDINAMTPEERRSRAWRLAIAALVSNSIYNFGELLLHPILDALGPTTSTSTSTPSIAQTAAARTSQDDDAWLRELLFAFNRGDLPSYDALVDRIAAHGVLGQHQQHLAQKIHLSCLTEAVFRRPTHERAMTFSDLSAETRIRPEEIEHLLMKALSLGLVRGTIDQVDAVAHVTWVQPKVLDMAQIESMRQRLLDWDSTVNQLGHWIESAGQDVWAA